MSALCLISFLDASKARWVHERREIPVLQGVADWRHPHALAPDYYDFWNSFEWYAHFRPLTLDRWDDIHRSIQEQHHSLEKELIGNAKHHFHSHEYRMAAVEAVTALEVGLSPFVRERCKGRGVSYGRFRNADRAPGVAAYLRRLLPRVLNERELDTWLDGQRSKHRHLRSPFRKVGDDLTGALILNRCINLNTLRNKIVHQGKTLDAKEIEKIKQGIEAAEWLLSFALDMRQ